jgi:hypothetical protein
MRDTTRRHRHSTQGDADSLESLRAENKRLRDAILDIDAHATGMGEDEHGFVSKGYIVTIGALHRALGVVGHTAVKCRYCDPQAHDCGTVLGATEELARLRYQAATRRDALRVARDFITQHPAVSSDSLGERWPLLVGIIDKAASDG